MDIRIKYILVEEVFVAPLTKKLRPVLFMKYVEKHEYCEVF